MIKLENVELVEALRNIVNAVTENFQTDFVYDASYLRNSDSSKFLFMSRQAGVYNFDAIRVYTGDTYGNTTWKYHKNSSELLKTYAVEVVERKGKEVFGNIYEIDYLKSIEDVTKNYKPCEAKEVKYSNGYTERYDPYYYESHRYEIINNSGIVLEVNEKPKDKDILSKHIENTFSVYKASCTSIAPEEYYKALNSEKLSCYKAGRDMIYVCSEDAYLLMNESTITVFDVSSGIPVKTNAEQYRESVHDYKNRPVYAIECADKAAYDKIDRKLLELEIKQYELENRKNLTILKSGYTQFDMYLLEGTDIDKAFEKGFSVQSLHGDRFTFQVNSLEAAKEYAKSGGLVAINNNHKNDFVKALREDQNSGLKKGISCRIAKAKQKSKLQSVTHPKNKASIAR